MIDGLVVQKIPALYMYHLSVVSGKKQVCKSSIIVNSITFINQLLASLHDFDCHFSADKLTAISMKY